MGVRADLRRLAGKAAVYGLGSIAMRAIGFLLLPLYTRHLTTADYGVIGVTAAVAAVLGVIYPLGLHGALTRFYFRDRDEEERRRTAGTIWLAMVLFSLVLTAVLDRAGPTLFGLLFREVPFEPYLRLAIWTVFFNNLGLVPLGLFQVRERPGAYVLVTIAGALLTMVCVIVLVVFLGLGVYGYLLGSLLAAAALAGPYVLLALRAVRLRPRPAVLKAALAFGLPLVPHGLAGWALDLSDRAILEHYVPLGQLGLYSLGYQFGLIMNMVATAANTAWVPYLYRTVEERGEGARKPLARLATYYALGLGLVALALALFVKEAILLLTAPPFHAAHVIAPWIVAGYLCNGLYFLPVNFLFLQQKTRLIPLITAFSGALNIGLNFWLVPRYGILAAAWSTFLAYACVLVLVWALAARVYPLPYEYRRLGLLALAGLAAFAAGGLVEPPALGLEIAWRTALLLAFPALLRAVGFFSPAERAWALSFARQITEHVRRRR